jgi:hypothetical protein
MDDEAQITVNGTRLTADEARIVRLALESFADILENALGFKDDGTALTDKYLIDVTHIRFLIEGKLSRPQ